MAFSESCIKFFVSGANFTFALGGLALIVVGVLYKLNINDFTEAIPDEYSSIGVAPILTIVVGSIIFVIAFFGCCGAIRESPCLLTTYGVILLVIFLLQIAVGVFAFIEIKDKDNFKTQVNKQLDRLFNRAKDQNKYELTDLIQKEFECCGPDGPSFWGASIPKSCLDSNNKQYTDGCKTEFYDFLNKAMNVIGITLLALSALEVIGCVFSLCLSSSIKNRERRFRY
ncbi:23 kDa integral membrane protein isoform X2 [Diabrotica virgifera virgifera]|uniref:Tetraspanin n=1 Tax=Diabrotica virgifera virgifera TaxID=50390 RepID=A0ABM5L5I2_DIAVI|nr:23 kDa integral membrane protein isoform X2 [Diabrotica virgifera virgifera]